MSALEHTIFEKLEKELKINVVGIIAFFYVVFLGAVILDAIGKLSILSQLFAMLNHLYIHALGIVCLAISLQRTFKNRSAMRFAWYKLRLLVSESKSEVWPNEEEFREYLTEEEVQESLIAFSVDARSLMIFAGDADFLLLQDGSGSPQFSELRRLGYNCKLLLSDNVTPPTKKTLKELADAGVMLKQYPRTKPNVGLRGRIKNSDAGRSAKLFDRIGGRFVTQELRNDYLLRMLSQEYNDVFDAGRNAFVKYILFDLAGVYCSGDFSDFVTAVSGFCGVEIPIENKDYWCVSEKLNTQPRYTIIHYVEERAGVSLTPEQRKSVRDKWSSTWTVNAQMKELATQLRDIGYTVAVCSNCDEGNAEHYMASNFFNGFDTFFSCKLGVVKPKAEYFKAIMKRYSCEPYECLLIDDHERNVDGARACGFNAIKVARTHNNDEKMTQLRKELKRLSIELQ